jgi:hypothetical protein
MGRNVKMAKNQIVTFGKPCNYSAFAWNNTYITGKNEVELKRNAMRFGNGSGAYDRVIEYYLINVELIVNNRKVRVSASHIAYLYRFLRQNKVTGFTSNYSADDTYHKVREILSMRGINRLVVQER